LHAKLVLVTTAILIFSGTVLLLLLDRNGAQQGLSFEDRLWASFFQSVSARTCGFNTVDISKTSRSAVFVYLALMFIGASPGGTGGGIKTTTAALLILNIRAILLGREQVEVFGRTVPGKTIRKAIAISTLSFAVCFLVALLLLATQKGISMESLLFETVSAFGTVGLSMGATMKLDTFGRLCIIFLMFVGRVGPLTLTLALGQRPVQSGIRFPQERVTVG
jgi:trk system potassium uptake protein TrkH